MRVGHFIIVRLIIWIALSFSNSIWVYKSRGDIVAAIIVGLCSIVWLANEDNRANLWRTFSSKNSVIDESFLSKLLSSIQIGIIAIFSFTIVAIEISKFFVRRSDGYIYIANEMTKNKIIHDQIGEIKYIAIGNSLSVGLSFKDWEKRLKTNLIVFGFWDKFPWTLRLQRLTNGKLET